MRFAIAAALVALLAVCAAAKKQDKRDVEVQLGFNTLLRTSARLTPGGLAFGQVLNHDSQPVYVTKNGSPATELLISNEPDFSSLLEVNVGKGKKKLFLSTHFESPRPATHYIAELEQKEDGKLVPKNLKHVDWSELGGLWIPCAGSRTPWQSHLAGEEYEPDARPFSEATDLASLKSKLGGGYGDIEGFVRFFSLYPSNITFNNLKAKFNPYRYGHIVETRVEKDGTPAVEKWYTIGRAAWEMALTMPDERTVYATDDGTNVGFFRFVADKPRDFSSGKLYAAKFTQTSAANGGSFTLNWIKLGEGDNEQLKKLAAVTAFADIFETAPFTAGACPAGFKSINQDDVGAECLKLRPGMATAAAFLETRRYAAYLGATVEFSKWEGITWDPSRRQLYTAMSSVRQGMEDNANSGSPNTRYDIGGPNHVRLPYNKCGCVYSLPVDRQYAATSMTAVVCGRNNPNTTDTANPCALDGIANPDNVAFIPELDTLLIAEDTENHENDVLWAHDIETGNQERILTTPYGAEVTSAYYYPDVNEHAYIMAVAQHPYESPFTAKANEPESSGIDGTVGYFTWSTKDMKHAVGAEWEGIDYSKTNAEKHKIRGAQKMTILKKFGESR